MITYILISLLYAGVFIAWMKTKQPMPGEYGGNKYWEDHEMWNEIYFIYLILGVLLWPIVISIAIIYKIAFKVLNTINKNTK